MNKGCFYWIFIGCWLEPLIFILKLIFDRPMHSKAPNRFPKYNNCASDFEEDDDNDFYSKSDVEDMIEDLKSDIEDEIRFKLEGEIREEIEKEYYEELMHNESFEVDMTHNDKQRIIVYDVENSIYPPGQYLVGEDIEMGRYLLNSIDGESGIVTVFASYNKFKKDESITYNSFNGEYYLPLRENGLFVCVENAYLKKL